MFTHYLMPSCYNCIVVCTGLAPSDGLQLAQVDMLTDEATDLENIMAPLYWEKDAEKKVRNS